MAYLSARIEIESGLIEKVGKCLTHANDKVRLRAINAIAHFAGSPFFQSEDAVRQLLSVLLAVDKVETTPTQIAMGQAVSSLATGEKPRDKFSPPLEDKCIRGDVIDCVIARAFAPEKGKTKGTGIWLASLVSVGRQMDMSEGEKSALFCALISRLFIAPNESVYCAKALKVLFDQGSISERSQFKTLLHAVIKHNKLPERNGKLGEKSIVAKESAGLKELVKCAQECSVSDYIFNLISLAISASPHAAGDIPQKVFDKLCPDLLVMVNHKGESIRLVGKNIFSTFEGNRRVPSVIKSRARNPWLAFFELTNHNTSISLHILVL